MSLLFHVEGARARSCLMTRVALVTGANKGVGKAIAQQLVASGLFSHVLLGCRDAARGEQAASETGGTFLRPLAVDDGASHAAFAEAVKAEYGRLDVLVNNAGTAFKGSDPTPFAEQTGPTLATNFYGTVDLTLALLPLLRASGEAGGDPRVVNVASMAGRLGQVSPELQKQFASPSLSLAELRALVDGFRADVRAGTHAARGWGSSNYGLSKLALIAATKVLARDEPTIKVNACCPGYCDTDMTSHRGPRSPADGARNAVVLVTTPAEACPTGAFYQDEKPSAW